MGRFVHVSTDEVYGSIDEGSWPEDHPLAPNSPYSASKASSDLLARSYHRTFGLDVVITRCSNNYGPYQFPEKVIPLFVTNLMDGQQVPLYGDGLNVRDWLHVDDHCRGIQLVLDGGRAGEIYNIGGGTELTNKELTYRLLAAMGAGEEMIRPVEDRKGHDRRYSVDISKISAELGYKPEVDFDTGLAQTIAVVPGQRGLVAAAEGRRVTWLVIGSRGQLGTDLMDLLGDRAVGLDVPDIDITDIDSVADAVNRIAPEVVVNCAAYTAVDAAETDEAAAEAVNGTGAANVARPVRAARLLHVSTDYVFDGTATEPVPRGRRARSPLGLRAHQTARGAGGTAAPGRLRRAHRLAVRRGREQLREDHAGAGVHQQRRSAVVDDQVGQPTWSRDLAGSD